jgi:hypothetical protein
MVVLDFSGTLSLEAVLYTREENLARELEESSLRRAGVDTVELFWQAIVNPTWEMGSTTAIGYRRLVFEQVSRIAAQLEVRPGEQEIWASASCFAGRYFAHSVIDPAWTRLLQTLAARSDLLAVVATDHYIEATSHIMRQLQGLGVAAAPALQAGAEGSVLVANSADLGQHKASRGFWERLRAAQGVETLHRVVLVDDFGGHEQPLDSYAAQEKVGARRQETVELLATVFDAPTHAFPFLLPGGASAPPAAGPEALRRAYRALVEQAERFVLQALACDEPAR